MDDNSIILANNRHVFNSLSSHDTLITADVINTVK